eukprot:scaffold2141_cov282-Pinguiococcus_pyrenoidosus.AAC.35
MKRARICGRLCPIAHPPTSSARKRGIAQDQRQGVRFPKYTTCFRLLDAHLLDLDTTGTSASDHL